MTSHRTELTECRFPENNNQHSQLFFRLAGDLLELERRRIQATQKTFGQCRPWGFSSRRERRAAETTDSLWALTDAVSICCVSFFRWRGHIPCDTSPRAEPCTSGSHEAHTGTRMGNSVCCVAISRARKATRVCQLGHLASFMLRRQRVVHKEFSDVQFQFASMPCHGSVFANNNSIPRHNLRALPAMRMLLVFRDGTANLNETSWIASYSHNESSRKPDWTLTEQNTQLPKQDRLYAALWQ